jgi:pyruvate/2-oxoglutarate/acetoin dehydrogenase E1 component
MISYGEAIREGFGYLLANYPEVFTIGQGLWSPWYVGNSMTNLDKEFGVERVIDTPVSEVATTGAAIGASLCGYKPIVIHPRVDFMILAIDQIVNQAAKWSHMLGGKAHPSLTIRGIVNRGGQQGAQHSQALHAWFAHIPGLRVVVPATVQDARDLLVAATLSPDPVVYIDDRWLYDNKAVLPALSQTPKDGCVTITPKTLSELGPQRLREGKDVTILASSFSTHLALQAAEALVESRVSCDVIDLRVINPLDTRLVSESVRKTGRLLVVDGGWRTCGLGGEIIASASESVPVGVWRAMPKRLTLPDAPAPTSGPLEAIYYTQIRDVVESVQGMVLGERKKGSDLHA